ncbi:MAG TPA: hypothetical protein VLX85_15520 [Stellaceae bacterium]|nr:hypothetical protein [Stellaceae bacterium]
MAVSDAPKTGETSPGFETSDWPVATIGWLALGVLVFLAGVPLLLSVAFHGAVHDVDRRPAVTPPAPHLEVDPAADLARLRAREDQWLQSYAWVDRRKGIVHIPIDEAMRRVTAQGVNGFPRGKQ